MAEPNMPEQAAQAAPAPQPAPAPAVRPQPAAGQPPAAPPAQEPVVSHTRAQPTDAVAQRTQAELARQRARTERVTGQPLAEPPYTQNTWKGLPNFQCNDCPYASLYEPDLLKHHRVRHLGHTS